MRILFVDDEPLVLSGLSRMLWRQQATWTMTFAAGGPAAIDALRQAGFDVLVSDLRMPKTDGAALCRLVRDQYPGVVRILLSGQADPDLIARAMPSSHMYLHKPCNAATMVAVLDGCYRLRDGLTGDELAVAGAVDTLPPSPALLAELRARLAAGGTVAELAAIVGRDPAMTAKMLHLASSSYVGRAASPASLLEAMQCLGLEQMRRLVGVHDVLTPARASPPEVEDFLASVRSRSLVIAHLARALVADGDSELAFAAGLLHQVGRMAVAVAAGGHGDGGPLVFEDDGFGPGHARIGSDLLGLWGLPAELVAAVNHAFAPGSAPPGAIRIAAALQVAMSLIDGAVVVTSEADVADPAFLASPEVVAALPEWQARVAAIASGQA